MHYKEYITAFLIILSAQAFSGTKSKDSLMHVFVHSQTDTSRIKTLFNIGNLYFDGPSDSLTHYYNKALGLIDDNIARSKNENQQSIFRKLQFRALMELGIEYSLQGNNHLALQYYEKALNAASILDDASLLSECYGSMGILYKSRGDYVTALNFYEKALALAKKIGDPNWEAACYVNAGNVHRRTGNFVKALDYYLKALEFFEQSDEHRRVAVSYMNIGDLYDEQGDREKADEYYSKALKISQSAGDNLMTMKGYLNLGASLLSQDKFSESRAYFNNFISLAESTGYHQDLDECYRLLGLSFLRAGDTEEATGYFSRAISQSEKEGDQVTKSSTLINLAEGYELQKRYSEALSAANQGLDISLATGEITTATEAYRLMIDLLEKLNRHREALTLYRKYSILKDSLFDAEKYRALADMQTKYEADKKEQQLYLLNEQNRIQDLKLNKRNRLLVITGIIALLVIIIAYLLIRQNRLKARHSAIELEHKLLRLQMDPHFIFNALIAIQSFIYKKDPVQAGDYLSKFAQLVRMTLENSRNEFVPLEKEIGLLHAYLDLQSLRFEHKFEYAVILQENIDAENIMVPPMLAQPFIENAIEHGIRYKTGKGKLIVRFGLQNSRMQYIVEDDGVGRSRARELGKNKKHLSIAMPITRERLDMFSKKFSEKYNLHVIDLYAEDHTPTGTRIVLDIPFFEK